MAMSQGGWDSQEADERKARWGGDLGAEWDLPERWSAQRKMELVLRLLRGEPLDAVSRESQVPAHELEGWKRVFLEAGGRGLKSRSDPEERELTLARAKVGELTMRLELAEYLIKKGGSWRSGRGARNRVRYTWG
jgi:transposase